MMRKCILVALLLLCASGAFAQRAQKKELLQANNLTWAWFEYSVINQDGNAVKDGPFSWTTFIDKPDNQYYCFYHDLKLTGAFNKGCFHGPLSYYFKCNEQKRNGYTNIRDDKFKGGYVKGVPDGNFTLNTVWNNEVLRKMNVTFKNGNLVGKYYVYNNGYTEISGNFASNGKMTGVWKFSQRKYDEVLGNVYVTENRTFVNGVATVLPNYDQTLKTYAQQYASNKITVDQLLEKGIVVKSTNHGLNEKVSESIEALLYWREIGGIDCGDDSKYQYLEYLPIKSEAEVAEFIKRINTYDDYYQVRNFVLFDEEVNLYYEDRYQGREYINKSHQGQVLNAVNKKVKQNTDIRRKEKLSKAEKMLTDFFTRYSNQSARYIQNALGVSDLSVLNMFAPYSSCKVENVQMCDEGDPKSAYIKASLLFSYPNEEMSSQNLVKTYGIKLNRLVVYVSDWIKIENELTFKKENLQSLDLGWGQVNKFSQNLNELSVDNEFVKAALVKYDNFLSAAYKKQQAGAMGELNVDYFEAEYTSVLNYSSALTSFLADFNKLKSSYASSVDVVSAIDDKIKNLDLNWKPNAGGTIAEIERYDWSSKFNSYLIPIKNRIDDFAQKRGEIKQLDAELKTLKDGAYVLSVYNKYYANVDISADSNFSTEKLDEVKKTQNGFKEILSAANAKDLSKAIKKAGLTDVNEMMSFAQNYTQSKTPQVEESAKEVAKEPVAKETVAKEQVAKEPIVKEVAVKEAKLSNPVEQKAKGYGQYIDLSGLWHPQDDGSGVSVNVNYIGGYRFNSHLFLGLGTGINMNGEKGNYTLHTSSAEAQIYVTYFPHSFISIPIYLHFRADFGKAQNLWRPYMSVSAGYHMSVSPIASALSDNFWCDLEYATEGFWSMEEITNKKNKGLLADINFGINRKLSEKLGMYLGVGLKLEPREELGYARPITTENLDYISASSWSSSEVVCAAKLSIGFSF